MSTDDPYEPAPATPPGTKLGLLMLAVVGALTLIVLVAVIVRHNSARRERETAARGERPAEAVAAPARPAARPQPGAAEPTTDPLKEAFLQLVRHNAADPAGLEIIEWARTPGEEQGAVSVRVKFRCKLIGHTPNVTSRTILPGDPDPLALAPAVPVPVSVDTASVTFRGGKIVSAHVGQIYAAWRPAESDR